MFFIIVVLIFLLNNFSVPFLSVQQDEMLGFGYFIAKGASMIWDGAGSSAIRHLVPVTMTLSFLIYKTFGLNYLIYNLTGLSFHLINGFLVYKIAKKINFLSPFAYLAVFIFFSANAATELIMWPVISLNSIALTFSLLAWLLVLNQKIKDLKRSFILAVLFLLAVFSVEYAAGMAIFIPLAWYILKNGVSKFKIVNLLPFALISSIYFLYRLIPIFLRGNLIEVTVSRYPFPFKMIDLMMRYFGQLFLGQSLGLYVSRAIAVLNGFGFLGDSYTENEIFPHLSRIVGFFLIYLTLVLIKKAKKDNFETSKYLLITLIFILSSSLPFLVVPKEVGAASIISSRYLYFGLVGISLWISQVAQFFYRFRSKKTFLVWFSLVLILIVNALWDGAKKNITYYKTSVLRKKILSRIKLDYPTLPSKAVFFIDSDKSYYGLSPEDKILPFQSGLGQTLLIYYTQTEKFPTDFYPGLYLWEIRSQGYEEHAGRGFGYFRDPTLLKETLKKYNIPQESIIAYSWVSGREELIEAKEKIKDLLK